MSQSSNQSQSDQDLSEENMYCIFCVNNVAPNTNMCYSCTEAYENEQRNNQQELVEGTLEGMILYTIILDMEELEIK